MLVFGIGLNWHQSQHRVCGSNAELFDVLHSLFKLFNPFVYVAQPRSVSTAN